MDEHTKEMVDIAAASTGIMSLAAWLPPIASLFTIVWLGLRIWESKTVQDLVAKKRKKVDKARGVEGRQLCLLKSKSLN